MISLYNMGRNKNWKSRSYNVVYSGSRRRTNWHVTNYQKRFAVDPNAQWTRVEDAGKVQTTWQYMIQIVDPEEGVNRYIGDFRCVLSKQETANDITYAIVKIRRGYPPQPIVFNWSDGRATYPPSSLWAMGNMKERGDTRVWVGESGTIYRNQRMYPNDSFWIIFASTSEPHGLQIFADVNYEIRFAT